MDFLLKGVQHEIQRQFNTIDSSLSRGVEKVISVLDNPTEFRRILKELHVQNPEVVNVSFIDIEGLLAYVYPDEFKFVEGARGKLSGYTILDFQF